jgi:hypothetical protein
MEDDLNEQNILSNIYTLYRSSLVKPKTIPENMEDDIAGRRNQWRWLKKMKIFKVYLILTKQGDPELGTPQPQLALIYVSLLLKTYSLI